MPLTRDFSVNWIKKNIMPTILKKVIAGALLAGSVTFAVLIIASNNPNPSASANSLAESFQALQDQKGVTAEAVPTQMQNLTADTAQMIGKEIEASGANGKDGLPSPEAIVTNYLAEASSNFDSASLKPKIDAGLLKIAQTNDPRLIAIYTKALSDALSVDIGAYKNADADPLASLATAETTYTKTIAALYALAVPQLFAHLHENIIANLGAQKTATEIIRENYQNDPVRSLLALEAITDLNKELTILQKAVTDLAGKN